MQRMFLSTLKMGSKKILYAVAGPNASGKSTAFDIITKELRLEIPNRFINPDYIAITEFGHIQDLRERNLRAAEWAEKCRNFSIEQGKSFVFETVMSTQDKINFLKFAISRGYEANLVFVTTSDPYINILRNKDRVSKKGHNVPDDKIISRYEKSMKLLPQAVIAVNGMAIVVDNSRDKDPQYVLIKDNGIIRAYSSGKRPEWVKKNLIDVLNSDPRINGRVQDSPNDFQTLGNVRQPPGKNSL